MKLALATFVILALGIAATLLTLLDDHAASGLDGPGLPG